MRTAVVVVMVLLGTAAAAPDKRAARVKLAGAASVVVPKGTKLGAFTGTLTEVTSTRSRDDGDDRTYALTIVDGAKPQMITLTLPGALPSPFTKGATLTGSVQTHDLWMPRGTLVISDADGLVVAIDALPATWRQDRGHVVSTSKEATYDEADSTIAVAVPPADPIDLPYQAWGAFEVGALHYVGTGYTIARTLTVSPIPPDWRGDFGGFAIVRTTKALPELVTATRRVTVSGYAFVDASTAAGTFTGTLTGLTSTVKDAERTYAFSVEDDAKQKHAITVQLPRSLAPPFNANRKAAVVTVVVGYTGGGPNTRGSIAITDEAGLVLAIGQLPTTWGMGAGKKLSETTGPYDIESVFALKVTAPTGEAVELRSPAWSSFAIGKQRYVGTGQLGSRVLTKKLPPPDWVGGWTDVTLVRTSSAN